ncbi:MAG: 3-oxoacyl-ACP synthase III, partial [Elusimicrobia bacterium]|nr:3-oxoacyl-ACP synthase III [Elusimicrobiota bacterium]
ASDCAVYDLSNACLGALNGVLEVANAIELGAIRAGLVVSCESAREINDSMIAAMLADPSLDNFKLSVATLTGGSGAAALLLTDGSFGGGRRLVGGVLRTAPEHHDLCLWRRDHMRTDAAAVLKHGVALGRRTWEAFLKEMGWSAKTVDKTVCHQVGAAHRGQVLAELGMPLEKDFQTYEFLGNMGTVSLPITAALAEERDFLRPGDRVAFLGIGSGLNCLMLGCEW